MVFFLLSFQVPSRSAQAQVEKKMDSSPQSGISPAGLYQRRLETDS